MGELTALSRLPTGGEGACCPSPITPREPQASIFDPSVVSTLKNSGHSVSVEVKARVQYACLVDFDKAPITGQWMPVGCIVNDTHRAHLLCTVNGVNLNSNHTKYLARTLLPILYVAENFHHKFANLGAPPTDRTTKRCVVKYTSVL